MRVDQFVENDQQIKSCFSLPRYYDENLHPLRIQADPTVSGVKKNVYHEVAKHML